MFKKLINFGALLALLTGAELFASAYIWSKAPTDTLRVLYPGFWPFESGRLLYWVPALISAALLWCVFRYVLPSDRHRFIACVLGGGLVTAIEVSTSILYWKSAASGYVRGLYESAWYWNRVPQTDDLGWPSFRGYFWSHIAPWAIVLALGMVGWWLMDRLTKQQASNQVG